MKKILSRLLVLIVLAGLGLPLVGCATPPTVPVFGSTPLFSAQERFARIGRNISLESQMLNEDIDQILLLRPVTGLTEVNVP